MKRQQPEDLLVGTLVGDLRVLRRLQDARCDSKNLRAQVLVECTCGRRLKVARYYLVRRPNPKTHCGCKGGPAKHRDPKPTIEFKPEYSSWRMMLERCYNPSHVSYQEYGGRGIRVFTEWADMQTGFAKFHAYMGQRPFNHTLDRIDSNGNYVPGNVRWATPEVQANNKRSKQ